MPLALAPCQRLPPSYLPRSPINQEYLSNQNATISCPTEARITLEYPGPESFDTKTTVQTIENYLIGICATALAIRCAQWAGVSVRQLGLHAQPSS